MKILSLQFKNLNSLYGEWHIDFTDDAYQQQGIFALTGPTGAGKTTILDAICLALYGRTPRLKDIGQQNNEIMSRHTAESMAEVCFETQSGIYTCHWSHKRSRNKAEGNLQATKQEIFDANGNILANKKRDFQLLVEQLTGMDFDRFTRSMLLAQGGFDSFLKADIDEKSSILEKITGTQIYSDISIKVYERKVDEEKQLDHLSAQIEGIELLSAEELASLKETKARQEEHSQQLDKEIKQLREQRQWLDTIATLTQQAEENNKAELLLSNEIEAFANTKIKLISAEKAQNIDQYFSVLQTLLKEQENNQHELDQKTAMLPTLTASQHQHQNTVSQHQQAVNDFTALINDEQKTFKAVHALDIQLKEKLTQLEHSQEELDSIINKIAQEEHKLTQAIEKAQQQQISFDNLSSYLQENIHLSLLNEQIPVIELRSDQLKKHQQQQQKALTELEIAKKELSVLENDFHQAQQNNSTQEKLVNQLTEQVNRLQDALVALLNGQPLDYYLRELNHAKDKQRLIKNIYDVADLRQQLIPNEPCLVCGSTHHPFVHGLPDSRQYDTEIATLEATINTIRAEQEKIRLTQADRQQAITEQNNTHNQVELKKTAVENKKAAIATLEEKIDSINAEINTDEDYFTHIWRTYQIASDTSADPLPLLKQQLATWNKAQQDYSNLKQILDNYDKDHAAFSARIGSLKETQAIQAQKIDKQRLAYQEQLDLRQQQFGEKNPDEEEEKLNKALLEKTQALEQHSKALRITETLLDKTTEIINKLTKDLLNRKDKLKQASESFERHLAQQGFIDTQAYLEAKVDDSLLLSWQEKAKELEERQISQNTLQQNLTLRLKQEKDKQLTELDYETLKAQLDTSNTQHNNLLIELGNTAQRLLNHEQNLARIASQQHIIERKTQEVNRWRLLYQLIGSADGKKFRSFAQGLTFEVMISYANQQLQKMNDRYLLIRDKEKPLQLNVLDNYQAGEIRSVKNLSGGESFIISLALALGLSNMTSRTIRVDSLFLDEGFGTLDEDSLETALDTLAALHQENKIIGIISHIEALKNRISTQIQVTPTVGGKSILSGPGIKKLS